MDLSATARGIRVAIHVQRASTTGIVGAHGSAIKIRLTAPPVDDAANAALVRFLAERFAVPRQAVRIVSGAHGRSKFVEIDGVTVDDARRILVAASDD